ncbi:nose resistant to fluoxetine protein 6-like [Centruroides vittatus]|uniref:nose resistant to fluoxetine protein 6-like n=1 Tax=Centruroides vittatus TaxID=120091 RepID=UPI0035103506
MFVVKRFIRLTYPVLCASAIAIILPIFSDGPHSYFLQEHVTAIEENMWKYVLHISNFYKIQLSLILHMWIMNAIFQLNIITAPVLFIVDRWRTFGIITMTLLSLIGFAMNFAILLISDCSVTSGYSFDIEKTLRYLEHIQMKPYTIHLSSYCMGLLVGYLLSEGKILKFGKKTSFIFWICSITLMLFSIYGLHGYTKDISPNENIVLLFRVFSTYLWLTGQIWMCIAFTNRGGGAVKRFLSHNVFLILDRLNVSLYIVHVSIIIYIIACSKKPFYLSIVTLRMLYLFSTLFSIVASFVLYLFVEAPFNAIFKMIFHKSNSRKTLTQTNNCQLHTMKKYE